MNQTIDQYKKWLIINGKSYSTIECYYQRIKHFLSKINDFTEENIREYLLEIKEKHSASTVNGYKNALVSFFKFQKKDIELPIDLRIERRLPEFITLKNFENNVIPLVDMLFEKPFKVKTILYFMFFTGLRVSEVALLERKNFDLSQRAVKIFIKKKREEKILFFSEKVAKLLKEYFSMSMEITSAFNIGKGGINRIFLTLKPYIKDVNFHPHLLRHSFANYYLTHGGHIEDLKELLGHRCIESTMRYARLTDTQLKKKYDNIIK